MKQMKRIIFTVGILSLMVMTAAHTKITYADNPSMMRLLASRWNQKNHVHLFEKNATAGHHALLVNPNQNPNTQLIIQHMKGTGKPGVLLASPPFIAAAAATTDFFIGCRPVDAIVFFTNAKLRLASKTTTHEKIYIAAIVNGAGEPINIVVPTSVDAIHS